MMNVVNQVVVLLTILIGISFLNGCATNKKDSLRGTSDQAVVSLTKLEWIKVQQSLASAGFDPGPIDFYLRSEMKTPIYDWLRVLDRTHCAC